VARKWFVPVLGLKDQAETGPVIGEITMTGRALMAALLAARRNGGKGAVGSGKQRVDIVLRGMAGVARDLRAVEHLRIARAGRDLLGLGPQFLLELPRLGCQGLDPRREQAQRLERAPELGVVGALGFKLAAARE